MKAALLLLTLFLTGGAPELEAQRNCTRGKPCGNTCIAQNRTCRVGTGTARQAPTTRSAPAATPAASASLTAELPANARFVASSRGRVYYPRECSAARNLARSNLIGFATEEEAQEAGYTRSTSQACTWGSAPSASTPPPAAAPAAGLESSIGSGRDAPACTVARITDGDTVACEDGRRIRLLLIDTPEMSQGPFGLEAKRALEAIMPVGSVARVELDVEMMDRYQRMLAYLYDGAGRMINEEMARLGYALMLTYPPNVLHVERIGAAVEQARESRRGLWSGSAFDCTPQDHRAGRCDR
jgi:endonuclease YncB( thermonuclease family)